MGTESQRALPINLVLRTIQLAVRLPGVDYIALTVNAPDPSRGVFDAETRQTFVPKQAPETLVVPANARSAVLSAGGVAPPEAAFNEAKLLSWFCSELKPAHRSQLAGLAVEILGPSDEGVRYRVERAFRRVGNGRPLGAGDLSTTLAQPRSLR